MENLFKVFARLVKVDAHKVVHAAHWAAHAGYFGFVFTEAHGNYRYFAGLLLALMVVNLFVKEAE